jgi:arsenate reductase
MAEAAAKHLGPPKTRIFSAGVKPSKIPPQVYRVMEELGIKMSGQSSKGLAEVPMDDIDLVVSFDDADKRCANLPQRAKVEHWPVPNPTRQAAEGLNSLSTFRNGRDEVDKRVFALFMDYWRNIT